MYRVALRGEARLPTRSALPGESAGQRDPAARDRVRWRREETPTRRGGPKSVNMKLVGSYRRESRRAVPQPQPSSYRRGRCGSSSLLKMRDSRESSNLNRQTCGSKSTAETGGIPTLIADRWLLSSSPGSL